MSWKIEAEAHSHIEDDEMENGVTGPDQHSNCIELICDRCECSHEIESGVWGHWPNSPDGKKEARDIAQDSFFDDESKWYFVDEDKAYCGECRQQIEHDHDKYNDGVCNVCLAWEPEETDE